MGREVDGDWRGWWWVRSARGGGRWGEVGSAQVAVCAHFTQAAEGWEFFRNLFAIFLDAEIEVEIIIQDIGQKKRGRRRF